MKSNYNSMEKNEPPSAPKLVLSMRTLYYSFACSFYRWCNFVRHWMSRWIRRNWANSMNLRVSNITKVGVSKGALPDVFVLQVVIKVA